MNRVIQTEAALSVVRDEYSDELLRTILTSSRTIAVVGASTNRERPVYGVMKYLMAQDYDVIPVNPRYAGDKILGVPAVATLSEIAGPIDIVDIFRRQSALAEVVDEAILRRTPRDEEDLWIILREHFEQIEGVLTAPVETKGDAVAAKLADREPVSMVRYRNVSAEYDSRDYFLEIGRDLLPVVERAIDERKLTPEFVQNWGMIMFCHGYVAAHMLDDSDDLQQVRAGGATFRDPQRKWVAHQIAALMGSGKTRPQAEEIIIERIRTILDEGNFADGFDHDWYRVILSEGGLATTYHRRKLKPADIDRLTSDDSIKIPPLPA